MQKINIKKYLSTNRYTTKQEICEKTGGLTYDKTGI